MRREVQGVDIEQVLVLQRRVADAGQRTRASVCEPICRRVGSDQITDHCYVDIFDANASARECSQCCLGLQVVGLAEQRASRNIGPAHGFGQRADITNGEYNVVCAGTNQRADTGYGLVGANCRCCRRAGK